MKTQSTLIAAIACLMLFNSLTITHAAQDNLIVRPDILQREWQFDFTYDQPRAIAVRDAAGNINWYWYLPYKVVNNTGSDQLFVPIITIFTDMGDIIPAGRDVPANVYGEIQKLLRNNLLENPNTVVGRFLQGEDQAKDSLIIWPAFKHDVSSVTIFIAGLSGEDAIIKNPLTGDDVRLNKTLMIEYAFPGQPETPQQQSVVKRGETWIMR